MHLNNQDYYTVAEFSGMQGVHKKTVYRWVREGIAPAHEMIGKMYWFEKKAAEAWQKPKTGRKRKP